MKLTRLLSPLIAGLILTGAGLVAHAQPSNAPAQNPPPYRRPQMPGGPGRFMEGMNPINEVLTDEQRASMEQAMQAQRETQRELFTKLRDARRGMFAAALDGKFDESVVRKQAAIVANLETEMTVLRVKALSQIQPPLSPQQIERIKNVSPPNPGPGAQPTNRPALRRRILSNTGSANRDQNDLPPKP